MKITNFKGAALVSVVGVDDAQTVSYAFQSLQLKARFVCDILAETFLKERAKSDNVPLLVCINGKSGGGQGAEVMCKINKMVNPSQVFDITKMGAVQPLLMFRNVPEFRILVCGGDGTVGWVLNSLADVKHLMNCKTPGVGIIPIGTGNDLSRVLGWGPGQ